MVQGNEPGCPPPHWSHQSSPGSPKQTWIKKPWATLSCWPSSPSSAWSRTGSLPTRWSMKARHRMGGASREREHLPLSGSTLPKVEKNKRENTSPFLRENIDSVMHQMERGTANCRPTWQAPPNWTARSESQDGQNCVDAYPTFLVVLWSAGLLCSQVPAAFAGLMYLLVRQKYFVGYLGERTQSTPGYIFGKRIILFLFLMSLAGIFNYYLIFFFGSDFENYIKAVSTTISPLLLIP
uniref:Arachidonate 5-lipoxygenase-activating protein n=1 Tax=Ursus maritimus TaxID=29073 RepID=A0A452URT5_URSMA